MQRETVERGDSRKVYGASVTQALYALGRFCTRFRWPVIAAWIVIVSFLAEQVESWLTS